jgi:hypothetical protein
MCARRPSRCATLSALIEEVETVMRIFLCVLLSAALLPGVEARGESQVSNSASAKVKKAGKCTFPKSAKRAPAWVCTARAPGLALAAVGTTPRSQAGVSFMEQMAAADARGRLVREVRESVRNKVAGGAAAAGREAVEQDGALITAITNDSLQGAKVVKSIHGPNGTLYVLVGLDAAHAQQLTETVTAEYLKQKRR